MSRFLSVKNSAKARAPFTDGRVRYAGYVPQRPRISVRGFLVLGAHFQNVFAGDAASFASAHSVRPCSCRGTHFTQWPRDEHGAGSRTFCAQRLFQPPSVVIHGDDRQRREDYHHGPTCGGGSRDLSGAAQSRASRSAQLLATPTNGTFATQSSCCARFVHNAGVANRAIPALHGAGDWIVHEELSLPDQPPRERRCAT